MYLFEFEDGTFLQCSKVTDGDYKASDEGYLTILRYVDGNFEMHSLLGWIKVDGAE